MPKRNGERSDAPIRIDDMVDADLADVVAIERDVFPTPWPLASFRYELGNPQAANLVARRGQRIVGYACVWIVAGELKINNVAVRRGCRRGGVGSRLLRSAIDLARARGCEEATLEVRPSNRAALALYERFGFVRVGRRKAYYRDSGEDAILMALQLPGAPSGRGSHGR